MKKIYIYLALFSIILLSALLYKDSFSAYFFQDDWFTLRISSAKNFSEILGFFIPRTDIIYYRPLGMQLPFFILKSIFGINPLPFHLLSFVTHSINIILVYLLIKVLIKKEIGSLLAAFFYGTSTVHYTPFFWSSTYPFILGPTMLFLSLILFLRFIRIRKRTDIILSFTIYILGLFTNEMVFILPVILLFFLLLFKKTKLWKFTFPYFFLSVLFLLGRFLLFPATLSSDYKLSIGKHVLNNLQAYFLWSFNWPEEMKAQLVRFFMVNTQFIHDFKPYFTIFIATLLVNITLFFVIPAIGIIRHKSNKNTLLINIFGLVIFLTGLIPVIFFPNHVFSYYLPISLVGLLLMIASLISYSGLSNLIIFIVIINWLLSASFTINFNAKIHWAPQRASLSRTLVERAKKLYPQVLGDNQVIVVRPTSENKLALNGQDGLRVIYNNEMIMTVYGYAGNQESL